MSSRTPSYTNSPIDAPLRVRALEAFSDIRTSLKSYPIWIQLGLRGLRRQYQRTYLGPLWISLQSFMLVTVLTVLRIAINDEKEFGATLAYVGLGLPIMMFVASATVRSTNTFQRASVFTYRNHSTSLIAFQLWFAEFLEFLHEIVPVLVLVALIHDPWQLDPISFVFTLSLVSLTTLSFRFWIGTVGSRFRDLDPILSSLNRLQLFICPIFWSMSELPDNSILRTLAQLSPNTYFVVGFRDSLIGSRESTELLINPTVFMIAFTFTSCLLGIVFFVKFRKQIPYWQLAE